MRSEGMTLERAIADRKPRWGRCREAPAFFRLDYSGDLWDRPALTGDWGGRRNQLAQDGISFELDLELAPHHTGSGSDHQSRRIRGPQRRGGVRVQCADESLAQARAYERQIAFYGG